MKNFRFGSGIGLVFIALFILNIGLVLAAVIAGNHLLIGLAIVLSCAQFYLHDRFGRSYRTLRNYPFGHYLKDRLSFLPERITRLFLKTPRTNTELTEKECSLLSRRSKRVETMVVEDNLLPENNPGFEYLQTHPDFVALSPLDLKVNIGTPQCLQPYSLSVFNFGALDRGKVADQSVHALSQAANMCGCAVNSGEKGLTPGLVRGGGDIVWHISYSNPALRNPDRSFNQTLMQTIAGKPYIKMIELRLYSTQVAGQNKMPNEWAVFTLISKLRLWSGGKPVGIHLMNPAKEMVSHLARSMKSAGVYVDFISIEESWAANRLLQKIADERFFEAVFTAKTMFRSYGLSTKVIATGVILTEYDILRLCALGADACFSAAGTLMENGLLPQQFIHRRRSPSIGLANFQRNTIEATRVLMQRCGYEHLSEADPADFFRRVSAFEIISLRDIFCQTGRERSIAPFVYLN
jgi:hypothetical protein